MAMLVTLHNLIMVRPLFCWSLCHIIILLLLQITMDMIIKQGNTMDLETGTPDSTMVVNTTIGLDTGKLLNLTTDQEPLSTMDQETILGRTMDQKVVPVDTKAIVNMTTTLHSLMRIDENCVFVLTRVFRACV